MRCSRGRSRHTRFSARLRLEDPVRAVARTKIPTKTSNAARPTCAPRRGSPRRGEALEAALDFAQDLLANAGGLAGLLTGLAAGLREVADRGLHLVERAGRRPRGAPRRRRRGRRSGARTPTPRGMPRSCSRSTPGRIAAATMKPRKRSARISFSFQRASATATVATTTRAAMKARLAIWVMGWSSPRAGNGNRRRRLVPCGRGRTSVRWESRRHAVVLVRPLARALALGVVGFVCFAIGWPVMLVGPPLIAVGALGSGLSVWRWERTRVVVTTERCTSCTGRCGVASPPSTPTRSGRSRSSRA